MARETNRTTKLRATEIASLVQRGEIAPTEVVRDHLSLIAKRDSAIGAFQTVRDTVALREAEQLSRRPDLAVLPLAGVPVAIKDCVDVAGEPTRHGSAAGDPKPVATDDELVRRLRDAGAIVVGKTKLPELAIWPFTESRACGDTSNPWDASRTPGGSSGGSAAAVASHMVPLALGSDGGGSIRIPAACCGLPGLKPTPGVVPLPGGADQHWRGLSAYGPLARNVDDLALMFQVLSGSQNVDPVWPVTSRLRIAVSTKAPVAGVRVHKEVRAAVDRLADILSGEGHTVTPAEPPIPADFAWRFMRRYLPGIAEDAENMTFDALEPRTQAMVRIGRWLQHRGWDQPAAEDPFVGIIRQWFERYDVLLTPTLTRPAEPLGKWQSWGWLRTALSVSTWVCTNPWNLAVLPAASVPIGLSSQGLPIGAQLVVGPRRENLLLALMMQIEQLAPWPTLD